ncbi:hypothetical protein M0805_002511 [Coniferiporia weirii]|nr:hypothetical protein M0805_002511 [Coniferiporia weirii]
MASWNREYVGSMPQELWAHIRDCVRPPVTDKYANYCPIIQSSGTGKSRAVDQLSIDHFVIPICLRARGTSGFPPGDHNIRDFLVVNPNRTIEVVDAFFSALFEVTYKKLRDLYGTRDMSYTALAADFRHRMTDGQTMSKANKFRTEFYDDVVQRADDIFRNQYGPYQPKKNDSPSRKETRNSPTVTAFKQLQQFLIEFAAGRSSSSTPMPKESGEAWEKYHPIVIVAFDQAAVLTELSYDGRMLLDPVRYWLRQLKSCSLFTLFLSTSGQTSAFVLPSGTPDSSLRIVKGLLKFNTPFTAAAFDLFAKKGMDRSRVGGSNAESSLEEGSLHELSLSEVSSVRSMSGFGRTL